MLRFARSGRLFRRMTACGLTLLARRHLVVELRAAPELMSRQPARRIVVHPAQPRKIRQLHFSNIDIARDRSLRCGFDRRAAVNRESRDDALGLPTAAWASRSLVRPACWRQYFEEVPPAALPFVYRHLPTRSRYSTLCGCSFQSTGSCVIHIVASCMSRIALMRLIEITDWIGSTSSGIVASGPTAWRT